jgi:hypothetical protein
VPICEAIRPLTSLRVLRLDLAFSDVFRPRRVNDSEVTLSKQTALFASTASRAEVVTRCLPTLDSVGLAIILASRDNFFWWTYRRVYEGMTSRFLYQKDSGVHYP